MNTNEHCLLSCGITEPRNACLSIVWESEPIEQSAVSALAVIARAREASLKIWKYRLQIVVSSHPLRNTCINAKLWVSKSSYLHILWKNLEIYGEMQSSSRAGLDAILFSVKAVGLCWQLHQPFAHCSQTFGFGAKLDRYARFSVHAGKNAAEYCKISSPEKKFYFYYFSYVFLWKNKLIVRNCLQEIRAEQYNERSKIQRMSSM